MSFNGKKKKKVDEQFFPLLLVSLLEFGQKSAGAVGGEHFFTVGIFVTVR